MDKEQAEQAVQDAINALDSLEGVTTEEAAALVGKAIENTYLAVSGKGEEAAQRAFQFARDAVESAGEFLDDVFD